MTSSRGGAVVVLTGANGGIGRHMLAALVDDGYRVAGLDVDGSHVEALSADRPGRVRYLDCDVTDSGAVQAAVDAVIDEWGRIDVLVHAAGIATVGPFEATAVDAVRREFEVNVFGCLHAIRAVLPQMRAQGGGVIHAVSSGTAIGGHPGMAGYAATKGALEGLVRSLRLELRDEDIACTLVQPPMTATRMTAGLGWPDWMLNDPEDVGRKLATKVGSTDAVVYADWQTRIGLALIRLFPGVWARATDRYVDVE